MTIQMTRRGGVTVDTTDLVRIRDQLRREVFRGGKGAVTGAIFEAWAVQLSKWHVDNFQARVAGRLTTSSGWAPVSTWTAALRRRGSDGPMYSFQDLDARAKKLTPLADTGVLRQSMQLGRPGNITQTYPMALEWGTSLDYARLHQDGGSSTFEFGVEQLGRLRKNVPPTKRGRRAPAPVPGHRHQWARRGLESPWNEAHFILRAAMTKAHGTSKSMPPRPMIIETYTHDQIRILEMLAQDQMDHYRVGERA